MTTATGRVTTTVETTMVEPYNAEARLTPQPVLGELTMLTGGC